MKGHRKGIILGTAIGMVISFAFSRQVKAPWEELVRLLAITGLAIIGFLFGQALDVRDELRDLADH